MANQENQIQEKASLFEVEDISNRTEFKGWGFDLVINVPCVPGPAHTEADTTPPDSAETTESTSA
jgi:hypothetical protein